MIAFWYQRSVMWFRTPRGWLRQTPSGGLLARLSGPLRARPRPRAGIGCGANGTYTAGRSRWLRRAVEVSRVVVAENDPPLRRDHQPGNGGVLGSGECERPRPGRQRECLADHAAMGEGRDALAPVPHGQPFDLRPYPAGEGVGGFGAGNDVPALFRRHAQGGRVALSDHLAEHAAFPVAEVHLPQPGFNDGNEA